jgi:hypothetical protein
MLAVRQHSSPIALSIRNAPSVERCFPFLTFVLLLGQLCHFCNNCATFIVPIVLLLWQLCYCRCDICVAIATIVLRFCQLGYFCDNCVPIVTARIVAVVTIAFNNVPIVTIELLLWWQLCYYCKNCVAVVTIVWSLWLLYYYCHDCRVAIVTIVLLLRPLVDVTNRDMWSRLPYVSGAQMLRCFV